MVPDDWTLLGCETRLLEKITSPFKASFKFVNLVELALLKYYPLALNFVDNYQLN